LGRKKVSFGQQKNIGKEEVSPKEKRTSLWKNRYIMALLLAVGGSFLAFGLVSPLRTLYARQEGAGGGEVGLMGAAYLLSTFLFLYPFGWLSDRYNRVWIILAGLVAHGFVTVGFNYAHDGTVFIILRFIEGITGAAVMSPARALLADLTPEGRNGEAFGLMSATTMFGILAGPPTGTFIADAFGYQPAYWLSAGLFLPLVVFVWWAFRGYKQDIKKPSDVPQTTIAKQPLPGTRSLLTGPIIIGCIVRIALAVGPSLGISIWSLYVADLGYSLTMIGWTYTVYAIPVLLVAPSAGRWSDKYGRLLPMLLGSAAVGVIWALYGWMTAFVAFLIIGVIEGSLDAIARSANDGYLADHSPAENRGNAQGVFNAAGQFGSLVGALAAGFLYEVDKHLPFFVLGAAQVLLVGVAAVMALYVHRKPAVVASRQATSDGC
jgi:MFS family permease